MGKILIIKGADFSKNKIESIDIPVPDFDYENLKLLMNYYLDESGNNVKQEGGTASLVNGAIVEEYIPILNTGSITIKSADFNIVRICEYDSGKGFIRRQIEQNFNSSKTFTTSSNARFIRLSVSVNLGNEASSYEAFKNKFNLSTFIDDNKLQATSYITSPT